MKRALIFLSVIGALLSTCGPPAPQQCCTPTGIARGTTYSGTIAGTGTVVKVQVSGANATLTFERDGHQVTEGFTAASFTP